jgi:hypothetical protein
MAVIASLSDHLIRLDIEVYNGLARNPSCCHSAAAWIA